MAFRELGLGAAMDQVTETGAIAIVLKMRMKTAVMGPYY
jgi:hypothetical protein